MPGFWKHIFLKWPLFLISTLRVAFYHLRGWQSLLHYQVVPNSVQNSLTWQIALLKSCVLYRVWHLQKILTLTNIWLKKYTKTFWFGRASEQSVPSPPPPALFLLLPPPFSSFLVLASSSSRAVSLLISPLLNLSTSVSGETCPDFSGFAVFLEYRLALVDDQVITWETWKPLPSAHAVQWQVLHRIVWTLPPAPPLLYASAPIACRNFSEGPGLT